MIKVSKLADYAVVILSVMASRPDDVMNSSIISQLSKLPEPTVSKILKQLGRAGLLKSKRGVNGGYILLQKPEDLTMNYIIKAIDGPLCVTSCIDGATPDCTLGNCCTIRGRWDIVNSALCNALDNITLADMLPLECMDKNLGEARGCN